MLVALGAIIPLGIALAFSTVPFLATVVILLSPRRARAVPYLIGYLVGLFAVAAAFTFGLAAVPHHVRAGAWFGVAEIVLGIGLIVLAVVQWRRRGRRAPSTGAWFDRLERVGPFTALGFALALNLRPKSLLVSAAAGIAISRAQLELGDAIVCVVVFTILGSITVSAPTVMSLVMPERTGTWLRAAREFIVRNSTLLTVIVLALAAAVVIGAGLSRL